MGCSSTLAEPFTKFGAVLHIDPEFCDLQPVVHTAIDCETDEKDNFVGLAVTQDGKNVYYFSKLDDQLKMFLESVKFIGHNLKGDMKWLKSWGVNVQTWQLGQDTALMSYVLNSTKESHHLKDLGKEEFGVEWSTYKKMVHPDPEHPTRKVTLDKQDVEKVAKYCGSDVLVTWHLEAKFRFRFTLEQWEIYQGIELELAKVLYEMETNGMNIDIPHLQALDSSFGFVLEDIDKRAKMLAMRNDFNINSDRQMAEYLAIKGHRLPKTQKGNPCVRRDILENIDEPMVKLRLEFKKYKILHSTFVQGMLERQKDGKVHTTYNQISVSDNGDSYEGIATTRLSSSDPNLQNIPARSETGRLIRQAFIPSRGSTLIVADYSQIEYRLLAHLSKEPRLLEAYRNGKDVHTETGLALGCDRDTGKTLNFAAIYGAQAKRVAKTAKVSEKQAQEFLDRYWEKLPSVTAWITRVKFDARRAKAITTLGGRVIPLPKIDSPNRFERFHFERAAVNYIIQGSAAEILKKAMIAVRRAGYKPLLTVHDELLFEVPFKYEPNAYLEIEHRKKEIKEIMEGVVKLDVPLEVGINHGRNWAEGKGK